MTKKKQQKVQKVYFDADKERKAQHLKYIAGSDFDSFNNLLMDQAMWSMWLGSKDEKQISEVMQAALAGLTGIAPRDEQEGMLATQMLACHNAAMESYRRAMIPGQIFEGHNSALTQANRLSRTYASLLEALNRHRGKGQQKMTVEHVHVHEGGQAIVGNVHQGGGSDKKGKEQPDAKAITHAPQPEMRREDTKREPVPRTRDAKR
jgi:hypothetical protein